MEVFRVARLFKSSAKIQIGAQPQIDVFGLQIDTIGMASPPTHLRPQRFTIGFSWYGLIKPLVFLKGGTWPGG